MRAMVCSETRRRTDQFKDPRRIRNEQEVNSVIPEDGSKFRDNELRVSGRPPIGSGSFGAVTHDCVMKLILV
jgi:hypothetical protein